MFTSSLSLKPATYSAFMPKATWCVVVEGDLASNLFATIRHQGTTRAT